MIVYSWNIRGLNNPLKQHEVVNLMKKNKMDVSGFLETKMNSSKVAYMHKFRLKHWKFLTNVGAGSNARIVVFWNPSMVKVELLDCLAQGLNVTINSLVHPFSFTATLVYGFNIIVARRSLWEDLRGWWPNYPWLVVGDKHNGEPVSNYEVLDFRSCCAGLGLNDLNYMGCHFTWTNGSI
jgi:hypothetical protein